MMLNSIERLSGVLKSTEPKTCLYWLKFREITICLCKIDAFVLVVQTKLYTSVCIHAVQVSFPKKFC